ncbi:hypothetical protein Bca52824_070861 [Brassica carinata]|uniref:Uncharacterized protein n=1 Tax=Brassica carinata TaxID=52824 RepID=A0A8X7Q5Q2_BRACI|nr:hypothetical protein Bca52824_070861 [Brassica carinata]
MPSPPEEETQPKTDSGSDQTSERDTNPPPPPSPQSQPPPSQTLQQSYPPVMGFPGYPQAPYPNYPNPPYNHNQYAYAQAPPASYYGSSYPPQQNPVYQTPSVRFLQRNPHRFSRYSRLPLPLHHHNMARPPSSNPANLTVENPNTKLTSYFNRIQGFIYSQNAVAEEDFLAMEYFQPVYVETKKSVLIGETLTAGEKGQRKVQAGSGKR